MAKRSTRANGNGNPTSFEGTYGRYEEHPAEDFTILEHIQRTPKEARLKALAADGWDPRKQGIILGARITDGPNKGVLHPYDGGTRLRLCLRTAGGDYVLPVYVRDMTEAEAAENFDWFNTLSKKPVPFDLYRVGNAYGEQGWVAVKAGLDSLGLIASEHAYYGDGDEPGEVACLTQCRRVVLGTFRELHKLAEEERWEGAAERLAECLEINREAWDDDAAHDADALGATARLRKQNGEFTDEVRSHLIGTLAEYTPTGWRKQAEEAKESAGAGSESRGTFMALAIATEHNRTADDDEALQVKGLPVKEEA